MSELRNIILGIPKLNNDEVNEVIQACKRRRARLCRENAFKFRRGNIVRFAHYQGEIEQIKIKKAIINVKGKTKSMSVKSSGRTIRTQGKRSSWKKAIVTLNEGSNIDLTNMEF